MGQAPTCQWLVVQAATQATGGGVAGTSVRAAALRTGAAATRTCICNRAEVFVRTPLPSQFPAKIPYLEAARRSFHRSFRALQKVQRHKYVAVTAASSWLPRDPGGQLQECTGEHILQASCGLAGSLPPVAHRILEVRIGC